MSSDALIQNATNASMNRTSKNPNYDPTEDILGSLGLEKGSIEDFWDRKLKSVDLEADDLYYRIERTIKKLGLLKHEEAWVILEKLLSPSEPDEESQHDEIYLNTFAGRFIQTLYNVEKDEVFKPIDGDETLPPFHYAAKKGDHDTVRIVVEKLKKSKDTKADVIESLGTKYKNVTAFELATEDICDEVVKYLLEEYPELAEPVFSADSSCIEKVIVATTATGKSAALPNTKSQRALKIFERLVNHADSKTWLKDTWERAAESIIKKGTYAMWRLFDNESLQQFFDEKCHLLHDAVSHRQSKIVQDILERFPDQIEIQIDDKPRKPKYPLQFLVQNANMSESSYDELRNLLVHAMIRSNLPIREIKDIGDDSNVEDIDTTVQSFAEFVESLRKQASTYLRFESVLKYAEFPDLNKHTASTQRPNKDMFRTEHSEISDVIDWLRSRQVTEVMKLVVPDRLHSPHSDDEVMHCVNGLGVRILDWKKPDLYLPKLDKDFLRELHLYSSGNQSVIDQWCKELGNFPKLKRLHIHVIEDLVSDKRIESVKTNIEKEIKNIGLKLKDDDLKFDSCQWMAPNEETVTYRSINDITLDVAGKDLKNFIKSFQAHYTKNKERNLRRIKIALIDSGVVVVGKRDATDHQQPEYGSDIAQRIVDGVSFVSSGNQEYLWWHASEPHGTQMATIICAMNPCCDLYVAKVAETKTSGLTAVNVAKAIQWAIQKKVDIISLSLVVFGGHSKDLAEALELAKKENIVVLCSTADEGYSHSHDILNQMKYRAEKVISIAACNQHGKPLDQSQEDKSIFRFSGDRIQIGAVPFLKSDNHVTGSSVATAIAAATASLILSCCYISNKYNTETPETETWKHDFVQRMFHLMSENATSIPSGPWVRPHNLCGKNKLKGKFDFQALVNRAYNSVEKYVWQEE
ncbi:hypothetical protein PT974_00275 [Cladobotryum mycophilum]|uniref:Peptidase S8/S53 domain-containing protein n=1 Tax=Cladobotryum mycophilum TaxID=491253 RepID=A0ABR0T0Z3_9HYPO